MARRLKFFVLALAAMLAGCAVSQRVEVYKVGGITFRLYDRREDLLKDVERRLAPIQQAIEAGGYGKLGGYHDPQTHTIYTIKEVHHLLHELKHELEPGWKHDLICGQDSCLNEVDK